MDKLFCLGIIQISSDLKIKLFEIFVRFFDLLVVLISLLDKEVVEYNWLVLLVKLGSDFHLMTAESRIIDVRLFSEGDLDGFGIFKKIIDLLSNLLVSFDDVSIVHQLLQISFVLLSLLFDLLLSIWNDEFGKVGEPNFKWEFARCDGY